MTRSSGLPASPSHLCWVLALCAACGRVSFDPHGDAGASAVDGSDVSGLDATICDEEILGVLFCESFEGARMLIGGAAMAPSFVIEDGSQVYRGARALHAHTTRLNEPAWILGSVLPGLTSGDLWARWYILIPSSLGSFSMASIHVVDMQAPNDATVVGFSDTYMEVAVSETGAFDQVPLSIERDIWHCVQMHIVIADSGGSVETFFDGMPGPQLTATDTLPANGYRNLHAGMWATALGTTPMDLWTDELVLGTSPIPCD